MSSTWYVNFHFVVNLVSKLSLHLRWSWRYGQLMCIHVKHPADIKNFLQKQNKNYYQKCSFFKYTKVIIKNKFFFKMLWNNLCGENGFRDFEEFSDHPHHSCKVLIIPDDYQGHDDLNSQWAFLVLLLELPCLFVQCNLTNALHIVTSTISVHLGCDGQHRSQRP